MERLYSAMEIAEVQLGRAIALYVDEADYISALTLAAAAEELFGKAYIATFVGDAERASAKERTALESGKRAMELISKKFFPTEKFDSKSAADELNRAKNLTKHMEGVASFDPADEAAEMIDRAVQNRQLLTGDHPLRIADFDAARREIDQERQRRLRDS